MHKLVNWLVDVSMLFAEGFINQGDFSSMLCVRYILHRYTVDALQKQELCSIARDMDTGYRLP